MNEPHHPPVREGHTPGNENAHGQVGAIETKKPAPECAPKVSSNSTQAQRSRLLEALLIGPVTTIEARGRLDILSPAARVMELRRSGRRIATIWTHERTDCGKLHRVAKYILTGAAP